MERTAILTILLSCWVISGCNAQSKALLRKQNENKPTSLDVGYVADNAYTNESLKFRLKFPKSMVVDSLADVDELALEGVDLVRPNNSNDAKTFDQNIKQEKIVFSLSTPESETTIGATLNLSIKKDPGDDLDQMLSRTIKLVTESGKTKVEKPVTNLHLGGVNFFSFILSTEFDGGQVFTKVFTARRNGHLMTFSLSYAIERESLELENILKKAEFFE